MRSRYLVLAVLFLATALAPLVLRRSAQPNAADAPGAPGVPAEALEALKQGRYWRASRILRDYLAVAPDTTPETRLLAAQAEAGWGGWPRVERLLADASWLDRVAGGSGWELLGRSRFELGDWAASEAAYRQYLRVAADSGDRDRGLAEARQGLALTAAGKHGEALAAYDRAARHLPQLADWIHLFAADAAAGAGDTAEVSRRLVAMGPDLARERGWRMQARVYRKVNAYGDATRVAIDAANGLDDASARAEGWELAGRLRLERGDTAGARDAFRRAIEASAGSRAAVDAARQLSGLPGLTAADQLRIGRLYLRHGNLERAIAGLNAYLDTGEGAPAERAQIRYDLARAVFNAGRYDDAEARLLRLADEQVPDRIGAQALYLAARAQYRDGRVTESLATLRRTADRYPAEEAATEALYLVADLRHDAGALAEAREFYGRAIDSDHDSNEAGLAMMRLAGMAWADGEVKTALDIFERYRARFPNGRRYQQATYWAGRAYAALGDETMASERMVQTWKHDPFDYYGARAAEQLDGSLAEVRLEPSPEPGESLRGDVARALLRLDLLRELGRNDAADAEVDRIKRHFGERDGALYLVAEALNDRGYTFSGIALGWEIYRREKAWNARLLRIIYPFPYRSLLLAEARERGVDPYLVAGLIRQESMFSAAISSPVGAVGLMQIMPRTGAGLAQGAGISGFEDDMLKLPEINLHLGVRYFAEMLRRYDGNLPAVLAAYNAGPGRVTRWREFPEWKDPELFTERIPYTETRDYVKKVQQNRVLYRMLYADLDKPNDALE